MLFKRRMLMLLKLQPTPPRLKLSPLLTPKRPPQKKQKLKPPPSSFKRTFNKPSMIFKRNKLKKKLEKKKKKELKEKRKKRKDLKESKNSTREWRNKKKISPLK